MKDFIRRATVAALANPLSGSLLKGLWDGRASIFMLHRAFHPEHAADGATAEQIAETVNGLKRAGAKMVSLRYLFECAAQGREPEPGCVAFTIDDGYRDQGFLAREFLKHGCTPTIFLVAGFIDGKLWPWDEQLAHCILSSKAPSLELPQLSRSFSLATFAERIVALDELQKHCKTLPWAEAAELLEGLWVALGVRPPEAPPAGHEPLTWDEIRTLESEGVDFGPHSITHRVASQLSEEESRQEVAQAWQRLQTELRRPLPIYAWPTGRTRDFGEREIKIAQDLALLGAVSTNDGYGNFGLAARATGALYRVDRFAFAREVDVNLQYGTAIEQLKSKAKSIV